MTDLRQEPIDADRGVCSQRHDFLVGRWGQFGGRYQLFPVVLDLRTGHELARVRVAGTKPSIGQIFIGPDAVYYVASDTNDPAGYVTRVTATPK